MSEESWKLEKFLCRCCLNEGAHKNLAVPFKTPEGEEEIYSEMLIESININLTPVPGPMCSSTYSICEECILRLRDAFSFKQQVLLSEKRFQDLYNNRNITQSNSSGLDVKLEVPSDNEDSVKLEMDEDNFRLSYDDDGGGGDTKSDGEQESIEERKPRGRKTKAKDKDGQKSRKRARKPKDDAATNEKKETMAAMYDADIKYENGKYACKICGAVYKLRNYAMRHMRNKHTDTSFLICDICKRSFKTRGSLLKHLITHPSQGAHSISKKHLCKICKKATTISMIKHLETHGVFRCKACRLDFTSRAELKQHAKDFHKKPPIPTKHIVTCNTCGLKIRGYNRDLARHMNVHGIYKCTARDCNRVFKDRKLLSDHEKSKHPRPMVTCGICGYKSNKTSLTGHQRRVHMKEANVACTVCNATFFSTAELNLHMVKHNPVKKYACSFCKKTFPRPETVKRHEMIHTGLKKKVCRICDARFVQKASLSYHIKKYHPETV